MAEWKLFVGDVPPVSTASFHAGRERAPHLEQPQHRERLLAAAGMVRRRVADALPLAERGLLTFSDLGCGDGGLLSLVQDQFAEAWGYDFCPANAAGWAERGVRAELLDAFGEGQAQVRFGSVIAMTEVLEHLADPPAALRWARANSSALICSSPHNENDRHHDPEHAWAWDLEGYAKLVTDAGWEILAHEACPPRFQLIEAR